MIGLGIAELLLLACVGVPMILATIVVLLAAIRYLSRPSASAAGPSPRAAPLAALSHQDILKTRYFARAQSAARICPRCRAALPADAPEGLCPACLLAGGVEGNSLPPTSSGHGTPAGAGAVDAAALAEAFPNLEILELLGQGGMGTVYKVRQKNLDRLAALKVIPPQAALDPTFAERFAREARALARLNHANIVTVYDQGQQGGFYFLLMEYIDGANLRQLMRTERIAPREALAIVPQICDALQYAHDQGIVHRDIKPENVLIDRTGRVKIADFGLAKLLGAAAADFTLTHTQQVMGTPRYMAPEQIERPLEVDHRADIYSLGVVIYEMLTGELPIGRFAPPSQKVKVDVRLDDIVLRTLEKEPQRRYQQVSQVKTELESVGHVAAAPTLAAQPPERQPAAELQAIERTQVLARQAATPPLPIVLAVAIGMVLGMLMMGAGLALAAAPFVVPGNLHVWAFIGAGIGTLIGGAGSFLGSYNAYRQLAGAVDLMSSPEITWFDYVLLIYGALGVLTMIPGIQGLLFDSNEEHVYPMLLIGGIVFFQALLVMLWRWGARQKGASVEPAMTAGHSAPKLRPAFMPAVVVPTLLLAAVWLILFLDFRFLSEHWPQSVEHIMDSTPDGARKLRTIVESDPPAVSLVLAAVGAVSTLCVFLGLTFWRMIGPRRANADGSLAVASPFGHPAWAVFIIVASFAAFLIPWVRLSLVPVVQEPDFAVNLMHQTAYSGNALREITGMPRGERYTTLGYQNIGGAAAAILAGVGLLLAAGMASTQLVLRRATGIAAIAVAFLAALILAAFVHQIGERQESLVLDVVTQRGLARSFSSVESAPSGIVAEFIDVAPGPGLYVAAAMTALLLLVGATQWGWSTAVEAPSLADRVAVPEKPHKWGPPSDRHSALAQVRGPGTGLIVSGVLGLLPPVLLCVAIPLSWAVVLPVQTYERRLEPEASYERTGSAVALSLPVASIGNPSLPVLLAQVGPPPRQTTPMWGVLMLFMVGLLMFLSLPAAILMILGGVKMRQLCSYSLANLAAIVALLPLGPHWLVSLPMGIWALSVLRRPEVKGAFE